MSGDREGSGHRDGTGGRDGGDRGTAVERRSAHGDDAREADDEFRTGWGPRWAIARRELRSLRGEKTIVLAICIQLFIAAFSSFLVVGLVSLYDPGATGDFETEIAVTGDDFEALIEASNEQAGLEPQLYYDRADAHAAFEGGAVSAVLDANRNDDGRLSVRVTAPDEGLGTTILVVQLRETLETLEEAERRDNAARLESEPLAAPDASAASPYVTFTYTILLPLLLFLPVFISGSIAVDSLIEERQRGTLELLLVTPPSLTDVVDAKLLVTAGLAPLQAACWLVLLAINGTAIAHPTALILLVAALSLLIVGIGSLVALSAPDRRQAQLLFSGGIVGALVVASLLPEHPANTVAKLAIGSATSTTWGLLVGYAVVGLASLAVVRFAVERLVHETL